MLFAFEQLIINTEEMDEDEYYDENADLDIDNYCY